MILVDANVLLYAVDSTSPHHGPALGWLDEALSGAETIGFPLVSLLAFVRIGTDARVFARPLAPAEAVGLVEAWLARPQARLVHPGRRHWSALAEAAETGRARGPLITDAHVAALALEHGAKVCTTDRDFTRFSGVDVVDPTVAGWSSEPRSSSRPLDSPGMA